MRASIGERLFAPVRQLAPTTTWWRLVLLTSDVAVFNFLFYQALRSVLLQPIGYTTALGSTAWVIAFLGALLVLHGLKPRQDRGATRAGLALELAVCGGILGLAALAASFTTTEKGFDYSWLRVEMIKTPLWFAMFTRTAPGFTAVFLAIGALLAWRTVAAPRSVLVRLIPGFALAAFIPEVLYTFSSVADFPGVYLTIFSAPLLVFWILLLCRMSVFAFRLLPSVLHVSLIALAYMGIIPVTGLANEFTCEAPGCGPSRPNRFGVARLYPSGDDSPGPTFAFVRKMVLSNDEAFFSYGPTCGIYAVQRETGALRRLSTDGVVRDLSWSGDGQALWATNWLAGDLIAIDPAGLQPICSVDLFEQGMPTPWSFAVDRDTDHVYMSNVTLPILAELSVHMKQGDCRAVVGRRIDFHASGYTRFTDGAFGLHVDRRRDRLYVLVGMLGGRYEIGLVEIELSSFTVLRDLRLPAGTSLIPVHGRDTALLPSYYLDAIYEVSLTRMAVVRTIRAAPTITAIEQDQKRGLFYATSRTTGELLVIDDAQGEVVRSFAVGAKPDALRLDPATDQLFLASGRGVFRIDLARFCGETSVNRGEATAQ